MNFTQTIRSFFCLAAIALTVALCACGKTDGGIDSTLESDAQAESDSETDFDTIGGISLAQLNDYVLVRPDDASDDFVKEVVNLRSALSEFLKCEPKLKTDWYSDTDPSLCIGEYEILIGACDREESRQFTENLKKDDYGYAMIGKKLVIAGGSETATVKAIEHFVLNMVRRHDPASDLLCDGSLSFVQRGKYEIDTMTLQGCDIADYVIVYPQRDRTAQILANELSERIAQASGYVLTVNSDKSAEGDREILIGTTNRSGSAAVTQILEANTYLLTSDGDTVCARGADGIGDYCAVYALIAALFEDVSAQHRVTIAPSEAQNIPMEESLKSMSFNLKVASVTEERVASVIQTVKNCLPDTIGVQEASPQWMSYLNEGIGSLYAYVGDSRDIAAYDERCAIFYRKDRFELIESGTKWMSDTPDKPSRFAESSLNRIFTYAVLRDKTDDSEILYVNTHLEHTNAEARIKQIQVLMDFLKDYTQYPIVLTGDFNDTPSSEVYKLITAELADSSEIAQTAEKSYTFHDYGSASAYLDFVFVSEQNVAVSLYRVVTEEACGMLPSDHYPLLIKYQAMH